MNLIRISAVIAAIVSLLVLSSAVFSFTVKLPFTVEAAGRIEPKKVLPVSPSVSGYIKSIASTGPVTKGQTILQLDCSKLLDEKKKTISMIEFLNKEKEKEKPPLGDYRRRYSLIKELKELNNKLGTLNIQISSHRIKSPFDGTVMAVNSQKQELIKEGQEALLIADDSEFIFTGSIGQEALKELSVGQETLIRLDSYPYMKYGEVKAKVNRIDNSLKKDGTSTHKVFCEITDKPDFKLISGLTGTGRIITFEGTIFNYISK
ncbi:MAG: efflux RND transporter periplasmic adaptor subunit [Planctomycetota bacterium]|jgi:multidrug resistance efflux pump